jgi:hypothetical protein
MRFGLEGLVYLACWFGSVSIRMRVGLEGLVYGCVLVWKGWYTDAFRFGRVSRPGVLVWKG